MESIYTSLVFHEVNRMQKNLPTYSTRFFIPKLLFCPLSPPPPMRPRLRYMYMSQIKDICKHSVLCEHNQLITRSNN